MKPRVSSVECVERTLLTHLDGLAVLGSIGRLGADLLASSDGVVEDDHLASSSDVLEKASGGGDISLQAHGSSADRQLTFRLPSSSAS